MTFNAAPWPDSAECWKQSVSNEYTILTDMSNLYTILTGAVLVACVFRVVVVVVVGFTPPLTRLLGPVATRDKRQSKELKK